jgi:PAS domain S-box-containing protein
VASILGELWATGGYIPHGHCYLWQSELVWLHILADGFTALAYYSIPALLIYFVRQRPDVGFNKLIWLFSAFIITCGTTHLMEIWTLWHPTYWLAGALKAIMAIVSIYTVFELVTVIPQLLALPSLKVTNENLEREIAERQRVEAALRDSQRLQRAILESANYSIISTTVDGTILSFNPAAQRWLGYTEAEVVGRVTPEIIHDREEVIARAAELTQELGKPIAPGFETFVAKARQGEPNEREWTYVRKDGSRFPVLLSITALRESDRQIVGFLGIGSDITERKQAEIALRQSKDELEVRVVERTVELSQLNLQLAIELRERQRAQEALQLSQERLNAALLRLNFHFENSPLGVVEWNRDFEVIRWSGAADKIFGWSAVEVLNKPLSEWQFVYLEDVQRIRREIACLLDGSQQRSICHNRNYHKDGSIVHCEWYNSAFTNELGELESVLSLALDVTDRDRVERMKNEFIAIVSHELRTPLTSIHGSLGMLASGLLDDQPAKAKRLVEIAAHSTKRLVRLINDILDIERIESGKVKMVGAIWNVTELIATAIDTVQPLADRAGVNLTAQPLSENIYVDADRIVQTLTNLLSNALKFSPPGSTVECLVERELDYLRFEIRDRGRGIPADKLETIFERFQQVDSSDARNHEGTGLGLAICRSIITQHNGQIWAQSVLGEGSSFFFRLPALK